MMFDAIISSKYPKDLVTAKRTVSLYRGVKVHVTFYCGRANTPRCSLSNITMRSCGAINMDFIQLSSNRYQKTLLG